MPNNGRAGLLVLCLGLLSIPVTAANLTTMAVQAAGANWTAAIWKTNGIGTAVSPILGSTYECVSNGNRVGNNLNNTRIRNPVINPPGVTTFPGDALTLDAETEIRIKGPGMVLNFPGVAGNPGLILNGGVLNTGDDSVFTITGRIHVTSRSFISPGDGVGGALRPLRGVKLTGTLSGSGTLVIFQAGTDVAQEIAGNANTFSGEWVLKAGWLLASGADSLGTNSITIDPGYVLGLDPSIIDVPGPAIFEPGYDVHSAGTLTLQNGGMMRLHQNCSFALAQIEGVVLPEGNHTYAELAAAFPANFLPEGSGSITILPYVPPPPVAPAFVTQPQSATLFVGNPTSFVAHASGTLPIVYRWQKGTNGVFVNLTNTATLTGVDTQQLSFSPVVVSDSADYRVVATNLVGSATSQVARLTVLAADLARPIVTAVTPAAGSTVATLSQLSIQFSEEVIGIQAPDLKVNGADADSVSGSGSSYVFQFRQPAPGPVQVYWDIDNTITDRAGNPLDAGSPWTYTLLDGTPPQTLAIIPMDGATVGNLSEAQVLFTEPVTGVDAADLLVNGVAATNVSGAGLGPYIFGFVPPAEGLVQFTWAAGHGIQDMSSNLLVSGGWKVNFNPAAGAAALTNIVLNEFLTSNQRTNGLKDEDLELQDWIELRNRGTAPVNLAGWSLTDDVNELTKWSFPATNIGAGGYLVVFASGKDRHAPGAKLHTNFRLNSGGGYLALYNPEFPPGKAHDYSPSYPEQRTDISYGLDSRGAAAYFAQPTPGAANSASGITGAVARVHFSVKHGFFNQPFNLVLTTTTPGATIVYTTDGSEPNVSGGVIAGNPYTEPISIGRTTVVRAAAFCPGMLPSALETRSYFFTEDIVRQPDNPDGYPVGYVWTPTPGAVQNGSRAYYQMDPKIVDDPQYSESVRAGLLSIPTMSIVSPIDGLFGSVNGIYSHPQSRGPAWERACSMELMFPDGSDGKQVDCGVQIQGGTQREPGKNPKHSFKLVFKGEYGPGQFEFPLFPDSPVQSFNSLVLDGGINYWWNYVGGNVPLDQRYRAQCVRDQYTSDLMLALGQPSFHGKFYHVYLNGLYWGLHYVHEMPDDYFAASYLGGNRTDYDVIKNTTIGNEIVAGDQAAWNMALSLSNSGLTNYTQYGQLRQFVDVDNLIDYMIVNHWVGNDDWPHHNWYVVRKRQPGAGFRFFIWDAEHVLKSASINQTTVANAGTPAQIYDALRANAEFRLLYADHVQKHFFNGGLFYADPDPARALWDPAHPERNVPAAYYMKRIAEIDTAIVDESARWGGYLLTTNYTRNDHWLRELNNLLGFANNPGNTANYFPRRSATVLSQYKAIGLFPSLNAPLFSREGGIVPIGFSLVMSNSNGRGQIFYTTNGTDPRVFGTGTVMPGALPSGSGQPVVLRGSTVVKARVLDNQTWSALHEASFAISSPAAAIRVTELMYNPPGGGAYEFIELQNVGSVAVDLGGYSFDGISFVFPDGTSIGPGAVIVLGSSANTNAFAARYPGVTVTGWFGNSLANTGERITLLDRNGLVVTSVDYSPSGGWPAQANGGGYSLEVLNPNGDPDDPANWRASLALNGSPGFVAIPPESSGIRFNEVMAMNAGAVANGGSFPDWLELQNTGTGTVSLANWSLSDGSNPRRFVFPAGTSLDGGAYLLVWCDAETNSPGLHSGFGLDAQGESLFLYDAATNRVDAFTFGLQLTNYSVGRVGLDGAWQLTMPTPGSNNIAATTSPATNLAINEWLANAVPAGSDWLELFNTADAPVPLAGCFFVTGGSAFEYYAPSFIPPHGFVQLFADKQAGATHLDFNLSQDGDTLALYDTFGQLVDSISFGAQAEGISQGRLPDGSANIVAFPGTASPGASNYIVSYGGPILNELMARNVSAVYDSRGNNPDWVELYNPNGTSYPLTGMGFGHEPGNPQWSFPAGASIPANGYLRVWFDSSRPASTNLNAELNAGHALNGEGQTLYLLNTNGQAVDWIAFGPQVADLSIGRTGSGWGLLSAPTPRATNASAAALGDTASLRINEWMADPASGDDWFELYNTSDLPVSAAGLYLTDYPSLTGLTNFQAAELSFVSAHGWVQYIADGHPGSGPNHVGFSLNREGGTIRLHARDLTLIDVVDYGLQALGVSQGRLPDGASGIVSFPATPTPGESNYLPLPGVVINEVLSHSDPPLEDAVELYNSGSSSVSVGGWFLSNSQTDFKKYRLPATTEISAGGYLVFYSYQFTSSADVPFTFNSAHGDSVYLSQADALGNLTGYRAQVAFGAALNGVSAGRFVTSAGVDFVPLVSRTFGVDNPVSLDEFRTGAGLTNSYPRVGPVVINEIMYHPVSWSGTNASENHAEEYIELFNHSSSTVPLYDPLAPTNTWKLAGGIDYRLPPNVSLPPANCLLIVGFDPNTDAAALTNFRTKYRVPPGVAILGPFEGKLDNSGERLELLRPDRPQAAPHPDAGFVPYVLEDLVIYSNAAPWRPEADGGGMSLQRAVPADYGNEPLNWLAAYPTPGASGSVTDSDGDGLPDVWEVANGLNKDSAIGDDGAQGDPDHDGLTNLDEYLAGTDPRNPQSSLRLEALGADANGMLLRFEGVAGHSYTIEYRDDLAGGSWQKLQDIAPLPQAGPVELHDSNWNPGSARFYRLVTPSLP